LEPIPAELVAAAGLDKMQQTMALAAADQLGQTMAMKFCQQVLDIKEQRMYIGKISIYLDKYNKEN
jgi:hypothetical protein